MKSTSFSRATHVKPRVHDKGVGLDPNLRQVSDVFVVDLGPIRL